jgi:hypothetical protein
VDPERVRHASLRLHEVRTMIEDDDLVEDDEEGWAIPPFDEQHRLRVMAKMCSTCIFRPGNLMQLRVADMLARIRATDSFITCHQTLGTGLAGAVCKGGSEAHMGQMERIARRLNDSIVEVTLDG